MPYLDTPVDGQAQADVNRIYHSDRARLGTCPTAPGSSGCGPQPSPTRTTAPALEPELLQVLTVGRPVEIDYSAKPRIRTEEFNQFLE
jgi:hypothetical protein